LPEKLWEMRGGRHATPLSFPHLGYARSVGKISVGKVDIKDIIIVTLLHTHCYYISRL
jgi:hypothetical protein